MANGDYQRTCNKCHQTWSVPLPWRKKRPTMKVRESVRVDGLGPRRRPARAPSALPTARQRCEVPAVGATSYPAEGSPTRQFARLANGATSPVQNASGAFPPVDDASQSNPDFVLTRSDFADRDLWIEDGQGNHAFESTASSSACTARMCSGSQRPASYEISSRSPHVHKTIEIKRTAR